MENIEVTAADLTQNIAIMLSDKTLWCKTAVNQNGLLCI